MVVARRFNVTPPMASVTALLLLVIAHPIDCQCRITGLLQVSRGAKGKLVVLSAGSSVKPYGCALGPRDHDFVSSDPVY